MANILEDLRLALRRLRQRPVFSWVVVLILGVGMGATTVVLDLTNLMAWRKLPVAQPAELVKVFTASQRGFVGPYNLTAYRDYLDYREGSQSFSGLAAHAEVGVVLDTGDGAEKANGMAVTGNFFEVLALSPSVGRVLNPDDDRLGSAPAIMISHHLWQQLGTDREVLGMPMKLGDTVFTVVGVGAEGFNNTYVGEPVDAFFPMSAVPQALGPAQEGFLTERERANVNIIGRLQSGVSRSEAQAELTVLAHQIDKDHPLPEDVKRQLTATPANVVHPVDLVRMAPTLQLFAVAVALLLVITCANIAHLLLARSTGRRREWGVRQSIGASRWRLSQQLLTENLVLALAGGLCGYLLAYWTRAVVVASVIPIFADAMRFDARVLAASFGVCLVTTLLIGVAPAWVASRVDLVTALKDGATSWQERRFSAGKLLTAAQVALCVVLLVAGTLLSQSVWSRLHADLGFDDDAVIIARFEPPQGEHSRDEQLAFAQQLQQRAAALPMVEEAGLGFVIPPILFDITLPFQLPEEPDTRRNSRFNFVDAAYFQTMGIPLEQGRLFDSRDVDDGQPTVVVNRLFAERLWPGEDPIGRTILNLSRRPGEPGPEHRVIGVVGNISQHRTGVGGEPMLYYALSQRFRSYYKLVLRSSAETEVIHEALRGLTATLGGQRALKEVITGRQHRKEAFTIERMQAQAVGVFAVLGLLLAALGIFGVLTYAVSQRVREVGIRMALGARQQDVLWQIVRQGMVVTLAGIGVGLVATALSSRLLESLLIGIQPGDIRVLAGVTSAVLLVALAAAYLPARRASRLDPLKALRHD